MNLNKVIAAGRIGKEPEMKSLPSGMSIISFSIASNSSYKKKDTGEVVETTEWFNCVAFGKTAEIIGKYFHKGKEIYVEGRLQTRSWDAQDGTKKYRTEVVVGSFQFVGYDKDDDKPQKSAPKSEASDEQKAPVEPSVQYPDADGEGINPEDIPFN